MAPSLAAKKRPPQSVLTRSTDGDSGRLEHGDRFDPTPMLDRPGGHLPVREDPLKNTEDSSERLNSLNGLTVAPLRRPARFNSSNRHRKSPYSRTAARLATADDVCRSALTQYCIRVISDIARSGRMAHRSRMTLKRHRAKRLNRPGRRVLNLAP
jgi:hypothetical protein